MTKITQTLLQHYQKFYLIIYHFKTTTMKSKPRKETVDKLIPLMMYIHDNHTDKAYAQGLNPLKEHYGVNNEIFATLLREGHIRNEGDKYSPEYYWNTVRPSRHMAKKIVEDTNKRQYERKEQAANGERETPTEASVAPIKEVKKAIVERVTHKNHIAKTKTVALYIFGLQIFKYTKSI